MTTENQSSPGDVSLPSFLHALSSQAAQRRLKFLTAAILLLLLAVAVWLLFTTQSGQAIRANPQLLGEKIRWLVAHHPFGSPLLYLAIYILIVTLGVLPVWWLQILAGVGFGLVVGTFWSVLAATFSAPMGVLVSRWFAAEWYRKKVEAKIQRLRRLDETLGHNGFLVVMAVRLAHMLPFGLSNYALGLIKVSIMNVVVGTFLGSIPSIALSVGVGAGYRPSDWRFMAGLVSINVVLLMPIAARYLFPRWFEKIGVE